MINEQCRLCGAPKQRRQYNAAVERPVSDETTVTPSYKSQVVWLCERCDLAGDWGTGGPP